MPALCCGPSQRHRQGSVPVAAAGAALAAEGALAQPSSITKELLLLEVVERLRGALRKERMATS